MPRIERNAEVVWEGNLARGEGRISAASSGAFVSLPYSNASRIGKPEGKTSPEELLAAAHGGCFASSLAGELTGWGSPPGRLELSCRIVMDEVAGEGHQIVGSEISIAARVAGNRRGRSRARCRPRRRGLPVLGAPQARRSRGERRGAARVEKPGKRWRARVQAGCRPWLPSTFGSSDVEELLTPADALAAVEASFRGSRAARSTTRRGRGSRFADGMFAVMACVDRELGYAGLKTLRLDGTGGTPFVVVLFSLEAPRGSKR